MNLLADLNPLARLNIPFWAQLTSGPATGGYYTWREQLPQPGGTFVPLDGGRTGTANLNPAFDPNGKTLSVASPTNYFLLRRAYFDPVLDWVYAVESGGGAGSGGGGGGLTVETDDTLTVVNSVTTLQVGHWDFALTSPLAGQALVKNRFSGVMLTKTASQSVVNFGGTSTGVTWDAAVYDTDSYFGGGGGTGITFPVAGVYLISVYVLWAPSGTGGMRFIYMIMTGNSGLASPAYVDSKPPVTTALTATANWVTFMEKFSAGGTIASVQAEQDSGGALNITQGLLTAARVPGS